MSAQDDHADMTEATGSALPEARSSFWEVLWVFLCLGLTSFGGPVAHLGYFRTEFVERRRWMDERGYADLVALCQFLPGPASSQVGMAVGLARAGVPGSLAAWVGFTLPSALLLIGFALALAQRGQWLESGVLQGLKVAAVAVVAQAVWGMAKNLCPDRPRAGLAIAAALLSLLLPSVLSQVGAMAVCGLVGWRLLLQTGSQVAQQPAAHQPFCVSHRAGAFALGVFTLLLLGLPLLAAATASPLLATLDAFYRAGALVFGGGHVVLPLLQTAVVPGGAVTNAEFLAGYGATQAVPGPLFTFAAYLGAVMRPEVAAGGGSAALLEHAAPARGSAVDDGWRQCRRGGPAAGRAVRPRVDERHRQPCRLCAGVAGLRAAGLCASAAVAGGGPRCGRWGAVPGLKELPWRSGPSLPLHDSTAHRPSRGAVL